MSVSTGFTFLAFIICLGLSAFFSGTEAAIFRIPRFTREKLISAHAHRLYVGPIKNPQDYLVTLLFGNTLVNIACSILAVSLVYRFFADVEPKWIAIVSLIVTYLILVFGEFSPKLYCIRNPVKVSLKVSPIIHFFRFLFLPVTLPLNKLTSFLEIKKSPSFSRSDFRTMVKISKEEGFIGQKPGTFIEKLVDLNEKSAEQIMTHRTRMECFSAETSLEQAKKKIKHSRVPIYKGELNNIVGVLYLKDLLIRSGGGEVRDIMRSALTVPETMKADRLLSLFQKKGVHIGIVIDEYGGVSGLVTLDDILESVILTL